MKTFYRIYFFCICSCVFTISTTTAVSTNMTDLLNSLQRGYDKRIRPNYGSNAATIGVTIYVTKIDSICEKDMTFSLDMYFRQYWNDPRLRYRSLPNSLTLNSQTVWTPDTFFPNAKQTLLQNVPKSNSYMRLGNDGSVLHSLRLSVTSFCPMNFRHFPMDTQICRLDFESFGYTMSDIRYEWNKGAKGTRSVGLYPEFHLSHYRLLGYRTVSKEIILTTGNYSRLAADFVFERSLSTYILNVYIPCGIIVVLSWLTFWLGSTKSTARVCLGTITTLIVTQFISHANSHFPATDYIKSVEVYLFTCLLFVVLSFIEFAVVFYINEECAIDSTSETKSLSIASRIDKYSRIIFPSVFLVFNFLYWIIGCKLSSAEYGDLTYLH